MFAQKNIFIILTHPYIPNPTFCQSHAVIFVRHKFVAWPGFASHRHPQRSTQATPRHRIRRISVPSGHSPAANAWRQIFHRPSTNLHRVQCVDSAALILLLQRPMCLFVWFHPTAHRPSNVWWSKRKISRRTILA